MPVMGAWHLFYDKMFWCSLCLLWERGTFSMSRGFGAVWYQLSHIELPSLLWPNTIFIRNIRSHGWTESKFHKHLIHQFPFWGFLLLFVEPNSTFLLFQLWLWHLVYNSAPFGIACVETFIAGTNTQPKLTSFVLGMTTWMSTCFGFLW